MTRNDPTILFITFDRRPNEEYIHQSLASFLMTCPDACQREIDLVIDGPENDYLKAYKHYENISLHPYSSREWKEKQHWKTHRRLIYNTHRSYQIALDASTSLLLCEDDVVFRPGFLAKLDEVLDEMNHHGLEKFILSLYSPDDLERDTNSHQGTYYRVYPGRGFYGTQAVYYSHPVLEEVQQYLHRRGLTNVVPDRPSDLLIGDFGAERWKSDPESAVLFACNRSLVQHMGSDSQTGLSGRYHTSPTFARPWYGYET